HAYLRYLHSFPTRRSSDLRIRSPRVRRPSRRSFNCGGGAVQVRRLNVGNYEVRFVGNASGAAVVSAAATKLFAAVQGLGGGTFRDRKSTRLNSSHVSISYA